MVQLVLQLVELAQTSSPVQADVLPALQVPEPSHDPARVSMLPLHEGVPHAVPAATSWHEPPAAHLPSPPQGGFGWHCPEGAGVPASWLSHIPFAWPVSTPEHAWHVPAHAVLQQKPLTQKPLEHWLCVVHAPPFASFGTQLPPLQ
jgi:hypothetical protein